MSNRNNKAAKVIEQEGEVDEDEDQDEQQQQQQQNNNNTQQHQGSDKNIQESNSNNQNNNTIRSDNSLDRSTNKSKIVQKDKVFNDIIGLKQHFEEYKQQEIDDIALKISKLQVCQEENQQEIKKIKENISEEEKIKQIRQTFQLAPLYILKMKGLKNRMIKIEDKLSSTKNKLTILQKQSNTK